MTEQAGTSRGPVVAGGGAVTRPSGTVSSLEGPVEPKRARKRRLPPQSEIAHIAYESIVFERTVERTIEKKPLFGKATKETITETVKKQGYRFYALAVGPQGRYVAGTSPEFEGETIPFYRSRFPEAQDYVVEDDDSEAALNALLSKLWSEGWQPTSWGQFWYDFRLRRVVLRSQRSSSQAASPQVESSDS